MTRSGVHIWLAGMRIVETSPKSVAFQVRYSSIHLWNGHNGIESLKTNNSHDVNFAVPGATTGMVMTTHSDTNYDKVSIMVTVGYQAQVMANPESYRKNIYPPLISQ